VSEKFISKPPNVFGVRALSKPAMGAYSVPPNPVPELKRNGRENDEGRKKGRKGKKGGGVKGGDREFRATLSKSEAANERKLYLKFT